jgi:hypothetical protein
MISSLSIKNPFLRRYFLTSASSDCGCRTTCLMAPTRSFPCSSMDMTSLPPMPAQTMPSTSPSCSALTPSDSLVSIYSCMSYSAIFCLALSSGPLLISIAITCLQILLLTSSIATYPWSQPISAILLQGCTSSATALILSDNSIDTLLIQKIFQLTAS